VYKSGYERKAGLSAAVASLCYGGNFCLTWKLFPMRHLSHTWSLAIEEQFYLIWPFLLVALVHYTRNRKTLLIVVLALAASLALERLLLAQLGATETRLYMMLDTRADGLLLGAAAAFLFRRRALDGSKQGRRVLGAMTFLGFVALMAHLFLGIGAVARSTSFRSLSSYTLAAIVAAVVIFGVAAEFHATRPLARILETRPLVYVGRISYGIYLWHLVIIGILDDQFPTISGPAAVVLRLLITFVVAIFSFHVVERPFLRLKYRFARPTANR
jgi:peptidoglycan/LPS O-acetylase OafA/YrhL